MRNMSPRSGWPLLARSHDRHILKRSVNAAATSTTASLVAAGVAFTVNILMARLLGPAARGQVAWVLQAAYLVAPVIALGVDRLTLRTAGFTAPQAQAHAWLLGVVAAVVAFFTGGAFMGAACLIATIGATLAIERGVGMFNGRLRTYLLFHITVQLWTLLASIVLFLSGERSVSTWLSVYVWPGALLFVAWLVRTIGVQTRRTRDAATCDTWHSTRSYLRHSITYVPGGLSTLIAARGERLLLPILASPAALGIYVSVATASELLFWMAQGFSESKVRDQAEQTVTRSTLAKAALRNLCLYSAAAMVLAIVLRLTLVPALGQAFTSSAQLVIPLCLASAAWAAYRHSVASWIALLNAQRTTFLEMAGAALVVALSLVAIPIAGALGAAYACLAAYILVLAISVVFWPGGSRSVDTTSTDFRKD